MVKSDWVQFTILELVENSVPFERDICVDYSFMNIIQLPHFSCTVTKLKNITKTYCKVNTSMK